MRAFRKTCLWAMRRYLRWAGRATRDGGADGGYIVWMSAEQYHRYTVLAERTTAQEFHTIVWAARDAGVRV